MNKKFKDSIPVTYTYKIKHDTSMFKDTVKTKTFKRWIIAKAILITSWFQEFYERCKR